MQAASGALVAGQVMVGDEDPHAQAIGLGDAVDRGDAVVDRDEEPGERSAAIRTISGVRP